MKLISNSDAFTGREFMRGPQFRWLPARCLFGPDNVGVPLNDLVKSDYGTDEVEFVEFDDDAELKRCFKMGHVIDFNRISVTGSMVGIFKTWKDWPNFAISIMDDDTLYNMVFEPLVCPRCGMNLVRKKGVYGEFLGCTGYPKCSYTASPNSRQAGMRMMWLRSVEMDAMQKAFFGVREMTAEEMHRCFGQRRNAE